MLSGIAKTGRYGLTAIQNLGASAYFLIQLLCRPPKLKQLFSSTWYQLYIIGVLSGLVIIVSGFFIGMVVGLQGHHTLEKFGAESQLGQLLALSIARELGPVVSALLFAGRAGSALTAEIGLMKSTDQLKSMDMMGVSPLARVVYPRFVGGLISLPMLSLIFSAVAVYGGYFIGVERLGVDAGSFWSNMQSAVEFRGDVLSGIIKSIVFAFLVTWVAVYQGFSCEPTAKGISMATTRSVVYASLLVLGFDFLLTALMIGGW